MSDIPKYYEQGHTPYEGKNAANGDSRFFNVLKCVHGYTPLGGTVLDVGCGDMFFASQLPEYQCIGIDLDTSKANGIVKCDLTKPPYPFDEAHFDTVICSEVLEHLWEPEICIQEMHRVIKPGGHLLVTVPNFNAIDLQLAGWNHLLYRKDNVFSVEHIRQYSPGSLVRLLEGQKFSVVRLLGNSVNLSDFFTDAREVLAKRLEAAQAEVDGLLGEMFPQCLPGMLMVARKV